MKPTEKNLYTALVLAVFTTGVFFWLIDIWMGIDAYWWFYVIMFLYCGGQGLQGLNEDSANEAIADRLHEPKARKEPSL